MQDLLVGSLSLVPEEPYNFHSKSSLFVGRNLLNEFSSVHHCSCSFVSLQLFPAEIRSFKAIFFFNSSLQSTISYS